MGGRLHEALSNCTATNRRNAYSQVQRGVSEQPQKTRIRRKGGRGHEWGKSPGEGKSSYGRRKSGETSGDVRGRNEVSTMIDLTRGSQQEKRTWGRAEKAKSTTLLYRKSSTKDTDPGRRSEERRGNFIAE